MFERKQGYYWKNDNDIATDWKLNATTTDTGNNTDLRHLVTESETQQTKTLTLPSQ